MKTIYHSAESRGMANHGWLKSAHSFSFAGFYDPNKMGFGALRVLNDDFVSPGMGFGTHPHDNMEIISIPLEGALEHKDSMGNTAIIKKGEVQIMSAGTGIYHSEKNSSNIEAVKFLQIWVMPEKRNITPRYDQQFFGPEDRKNQWQVVVSPLGKEENGVKINQNSWFFLTDLDAGKNLGYTLKQVNNGVYLFVLKGAIQVNDKTLKERDAIGIYDTRSFEIKASKDSEILAIEIPLK